MSGRRLWGLFKERFGSPEKFFKEHFVANYCPLAFVEQSGLNRTPNKLPPSEKNPLLEICDAHLRRTLEILEPEWLIGVGAWAKERGEIAAKDLNIKVGQICIRVRPVRRRIAAGRSWRPGNWLNWALETLKIRRFFPKHSWIWP
ncbi:MAG: hypothetical protein WDM76_12470 [Limisphaerales bacterium]